MLMSIPCFDEGKNLELACLAVGDRLTITGRGWRGEEFEVTQDGKMLGCRVLEDGKMTSRGFIERRLRFMRAAALGEIDVTITGGEPEHKEEYQ